jgi:hypothetical protein
MTINDASQKQKLSSLYSWLRQRYNGVDLTKTRKNKYGLSYKSMYIRFLVFVESAQIKSNQCLSCVNKENYELLPSQANIQVSHHHKSHMKVIDPRICRYSIVINKVATHKTSQSISFVWFKQ